MDTSTERCRESAESSSLFYTESAPGREAIFPDSTHTQPDIQRVVGSSPKCEIPAPSHGIALAGEKRKQPDTQQTAGNASKRIKTAVRCSSVGDSESLRSCASVPRSKPKSFRIAGIPSNWTQHDLLVALRTIDPDFNHRSHQLSLYPACCGHTQTSLVCLDTCTKYFQSLEPNEYKYERVYDTVNKTVADLVFDCHFYDLTPLNKPKGEIVADVVAVTGLAGHAFGSWRSRETQRMWLKDFLPKHVMGIRVMTYGYDSSLVGHTRSRSVLSDYRRNFIQQLENSRSSSESRPIIFLGHSMGGILILQTLVESKRNPRYQHILDSTRGIFFFGTPHQGLRINELKEMIDTEAGGEESRVNLLKQLDEGSEFLETQKEDLLRVWGEFQGKIFSFYETVKTSTVRKLESGKYERGGPEVMMVKNFSSKIYLPYEYRLPVEKNHTDMVKFASEVDTTFQTVVKHMKDCIASTPTPKMLLSAIDRVKLDQFLKMLLKVDQEEYRSTIQSLDCNDPKFYWIFRNVNFRHWRSANHPQVLWLSGPPKCQIHQVSSYIVDSGKALEKQRPVLYFFCSTATGKKPIVTTFVHTLLHQFIQFSPVDKKIWIVRNFLRALLERELASSPTLSHLKSEDSLDTTIKTILDASTNGLWYALKSVLADEQNSELWVVIDGLDEAEHQKGKFVRDVHTFVMHLEGISKVRALLTSRPQAEINEIFNGLPCIEYDKERKEYLASLHFDNIRYGKISEEHKDSLGWLWTHNQYTTWSASDVSRLLYIQGKPGSGKSTLTKYFKDNLLKRESEAKSATVASFFYSYREGALQTSHSNMLRSILYDILYQNEFFFYHFQFEYRRYWVSLRERGHGDLTKWPYELLKRTLSSIGDHLQAERLYLIIDAVDESDDEDRRDILRLLFDLCSKQKRCIVKVFVASRPVVQLEHQIAKFHNIIRLQDETKQDISSFTQSFLRPLLFTDFLDRATQYIVEHAQGVFLWVQLVKGELAGYVEEGASENDIFEFLRGLPTELEDLYEHMLGKLENNKRGLEHGIKMIRFVLFVRRPLAVDELRHALGIPDNPDTEYTPSDEDFQRSIPAKPGESHEIDPMVQRIIHCGGNFLETKGDHDNKTVQVMHQTVREFFLRPDRYVASSKFRMSGQDAHICISLTCIRYLMLCAANTTPLSSFPDIESWTSNHFKYYAQYLNERPLINYALRYLRHHVDSCHQVVNILYFISLLIDRLAENPAAYLLGSWMNLHLSKPLPGHERNGDAESFRNRLLHAAVGMRLSRVTEALLAVGAKIESRVQGKTPLLVSAERGDGTTARLLLENGADVTVEGGSGWTALHRAAENGHEEMVGLLVEKGANIVVKDSDGQTALHLAAKEGHKAVAQLLIKKGADVAVEDGSGRTALHWAARGGHEAVARLLVGEVAGVGAKDSNGRTALHWASHEAVARLLMDNGAYVGEEDVYRRTPLHWATEDGYEAVALALIRRGADVTAKALSKQTALHLAAENGHGAMVRLLIAKGADIATKDSDGRTALHWAAGKGHEATVQLLIEKGADIFAKAVSGRTPLHWAAENEHRAVVQLLTPLCRPLTNRPRQPPR